MDHTPDAEAGEPTRKPLPQSREETAVRVVTWADPGRIWKEELRESPDGLHAGHKRQRDVRVVPGHSRSWRKTLRKDLGVGWGEWQEVCLRHVTFSMPCGLPDGNARQAGSI